MKVSSVLVPALVAAAVGALPAHDSSSQQPLGAPAPAEQFLIELAPGKTRWVSEEGKWALKREGINFMDITNHPELGTARSRRVAAFSDNPSYQKTFTFPEKPAQSSTISTLIPHLSKERMRRDLEKFSSFFTRYYKSHYGAESAAWLLGTINNTIAESATASASVRIARFEHPWGQPSLILTIPGRTNRTVVIGAHQDSINGLLPSLLPAPGADDDGSGAVTILEALRVLLSNATADNPLLHGRATNTLEFHWYSAEEGGLLGSQAVFEAYADAGRDVRAMLQQDMTGYVQGTLDAGRPESVGVITDFVHEGLTTFIKEIVTKYCDIPYTETKCGYACSDHASASKAGYPSAFVIESDFSLANLDRIHTAEDKIEYLSFDHMLQHARLTLGLAYELAMADF